MEIEQGDFMDEIFKTVQLPDVKYTDPNYKPNVKIVKQNEMQVTHLVGHHEYTNGYSHETLEYSSKEIHLSGAHENGHEDNHFKDQEATHNHYDEISYTETHHYDEASHTEHDEHINGFEDEEHEATLEEVGWKSVVHNEVFIEGSDFSAKQEVSELTSHEVVPDTQSEVHDSHEEEPVHLHHDTVTSYNDEQNIHIGKPETPTSEIRLYEEQESADESPTLPRKTDTHDRLIEEFKRHHSEQHNDDISSTTGTLDNVQLGFDQYDYQQNAEHDSDEDTETGVIAVRKVEYHFDSDAVNQEEKMIHDEHMTHEEFEPHYEEQRYEAAYDDISNEIRSENQDKESTYSEFERYVGVEYDLHKQSADDLHLSEPESVEQYHQIEVKTRSSTESTLTPGEDQQKEQYPRDVEVRTPLHAYPQGHYSVMEDEAAKQVLDEIKEAPGVKSLKSMFEKEGGTMSKALIHHHHTLEKQEHIHHYQTEEDMHHEVNQERSRTPSVISERSRTPSIRSDVDEQYDYIDNSEYQTFTENQIAHAVSKKGEAEVVYEHQLTVEELRAKFGSVRAQNKLAMRQTHPKIEDAFVNKSRASTTSTVHTQISNTPVQAKFRTSTTSTIHTHDSKVQQRSRTSTTSTVKTEPIHEKSRTSTISTVASQPHEPKSRTSTTSSVHTLKEAYEPNKSRTSTITSEQTIKSEKRHQPIKSRSTTTSTVHSAVEPKSRTSTLSSVRTTTEPEHIVKSRTSTASSISTLRSEQHQPENLEIESRPQPKRRESVNSTTQAKKEKEPPIGSLAALQKSLKTYGAYAPKEIPVSPITSPTSPTSPHEKFHSVRVVKNVREFVKVWGNQPMEIAYEPRRRHTPKLDTLEEQPVKIDRATSYHTIDVEVQSTRGDLSKRSSIVSVYSQMSKKQLPTHHEVIEESEELPEVKMELAEAIHDSTNEFDDEVLSKMSVRERMKFFQQQRHEENHRRPSSVIDASRLDDITEDEVHQDKIMNADDEYVPKTRVKRNISLLIQELTRGH